MRRRDVLRLVAASAIAKPSIVLAAAGQNTKADIVVIGAGGAGYSAAVTAHDAGAKVIVLEKMPITGGNTQIASGGMNAAGTKHQTAQGIKDSWELMRDGYHLSVDLVDKAILFLANHESVAPEKPWLLWLAFGACHAPHHVPKEWIDKYKGKFDKGWDKVREETLERQKRMGIVPEKHRISTTQ